MNRIILCLLLSLLAFGAVCAANVLDETGIKRLVTEEDARSFLGAELKPSVVLVLDTSDKTVNEETWKPALSILYQTVATIGVEVRRVDMNSPAADLFTRFSGGHQTILYFDGLYLMPDMSERGLTKPVKVFEGELSPVTLVNFVLESISPLALERVDNFRDVQSLFSLYPGYPKIPRILYFTNNDHVSPMLRSLSQQLAYSSVMGVVEEAFSTADKRAIAKHYGIESKAELPLFVVLFPSDGNRDEVVKVEGLQSHSVIGDVARALKRAARITDGEGDASTNHTYKLRLNYMVTEMNRRWVALKKEKVLSAKVMCHVIRNRKEWDDFMVVPPGQFAAIAFAKKEDISRAKDILINATRSIMEQMVAPVAQNRFMRLGVVDETLARDVRQFFKAGADGGSPSLVFIQRDGDEGSVYYDFNGKFVPERIAHVFVSIVGESTQKPHPFKMSKVPGLKLDVKDGGDAGDL